MRLSYSTFTARQALRHGLQVALFNMLLWGLSLLANGTERWDIELAYTQSIGLSIWGLIEAGRFWLSPPGHAWPSWQRALPMIALAVPMGWLIGSQIGNLYCGCSNWTFLSQSPRRLRNTIAFTVGASTVAIYFFYSRGRAMADREKLAAAERDATLARLSVLQSQLEPHMLFNTLANLRVLIALDPARAQAMLDCLIAFLRATLTASRSTSHALAEEFERLEDYLELMSVRMGARLSTQLSLPDDLREMRVPPLLLQPLVENAIKHGLEPKVEGGHIEIAAQRDGHTLQLSVRDSGLGFGNGHGDGPGTQFGLRQVRERLLALYGERASLSIDALPEGGTLARITMPLEVSEQ